MLYEKQERKKKGRVTCLITICFEEDERNTGDTANKRILLHVLSKEFHRHEAPTDVRQQLLESTFLLCRLELIHIFHDQLIQCLFGFNRQIITFDHRSPCFNRQGHHPLLVLCQNGCEVGGKECATLSGELFAVVFVHQIEKEEYIC